MNVFSERLKELLDKRGMSQRELADKIGTTEVSVSRYIKGERTPKGPVITKIAQVLNVSTDYLLRDDVDSDDTGCMWCKDIEDRHFRIEFWWGHTASFERPHVIATGIANICPKCGRKLRT